MAMVIQTSVSPSGRSITGTSPGAPGPWLVPWVSIAAFHTAFPVTVVQTCVNHVIRNAMKFLGPAVTRVVRALEAEHLGLGTIPGGPPIPIEDPSVLHVSAADKIVALTSMMRRAATAPDPAAFWARRHAFRALVPYFRAFHTETAPHLPASMAADLNRIVTAQESRTYGQPPTRWGDVASRGWVIS